MTTPGELLYNVIFISLALEVCGVTLLALSSVGPSRLALAKVCGTYWGRNIHLYKSFMRQRFDSRCGMTFLLAGIGVQAWSVATGVMELPQAASELLWAFAGIVLCVFAAWRDWLYWEDSNVELDRLLGADE